MHSNITIANEFIRIADRENKSLLGVELEDLVFLANGIYLWCYSKPLVADVFQATAGGPSCFPYYRRSIENIVDESGKVDKFFHDLKIDKLFKTKRFYVPTLDNSRDNYEIRRILYNIWIKDYVLPNGFARIKGGAWHKAWFDRDGKNRPGTNLRDEDIKSDFDKLENT